MDLEPALSVDGLQMFFVSRRPAVGSGEPVDHEDIWVVDRVDDGCGAPRNLGAPINTLQSEFFPSVTDGLMVAEHFVLDTTRTRIRGEGEIDLAEMTINLRLKPRPKTRGFLSLATPVRIKGPLTDPSLTIKKGGLAITGLRLYYALWTFWLELLRKPLPADGSDICIDPPKRELTLVSE